jgi:hypothetical protein
VLCDEGGVASREASRGVRREESSRNRHPSRNRQPLRRLNVSCNRFFTTPYTANRCTIGIRANRKVESSVCDTEMHLE